jgi:hypothetical protein
MHANMGMWSQAGFTDSASGVRIRPTSYCRAVPQVLQAAPEAGRENGLGSRFGLGRVSGRQVSEVVGMIMPVE